MDMLLGRDSPAISSTDKESPKTQRIKELGTRPSLSTRELNKNAMLSLQIT